MEAKQEKFFAFRRKFSDRHTNRKQTVYAHCSSNRKTSAVFKLGLLD